MRLASIAGLGEAVVNPLTRELLLQYTACEDMAKSGHFNTRAADIAAELPRTRTASSNWLELWNERL